MSDPALFKWRPFHADMILCAVRWYRRYALSSRDVEELMRARGLAVDHTTIFRWVPRYAPALDQRCQPQLQATNDSCRVLRQGKYLHKVVDQDHRFVKRRVNPGLGGGAFHTAQRTLQGYEAIHLLRQGQLDGLAKRDGLGQTRGINQLFGLAASRVLAQPLLTPRAVFAPLPTRQAEILTSREHGYRVTSQRPFCRSVKDFTTWPYPGLPICGADSAT